MNRFVLLIFGLIGGLLLGIGATLFYLAPKSAEKLPGTPLKSPEANGIPAGTVALRLNQDFFGKVVESLFADKEPSFPLNLGALSSSSADCTGTINLKKEGSGTQTAVVLENGQIIVPLAFNGKANVLGNCLQFNGAAQANLILNYDEASKNVLGQINVQNVNLDGVAPVAGALLVPVVQSTINQRINPLKILNTNQIALNLPIAATNSILDARVAQVTSDVKDNALNLYVTYNFATTQAAPPTVTP